MGSKFQNPLYAFWHDVLTSIAPSLAKMGFQRRDHVWYRYSQQVLQLIEFRLGERKLGIRFGIVIRKLNGATHPNLGDCHLRFGVWPLLTEDERTAYDAARDLRAEDRSVDVTASVFLACVRNQVLPILNNATAISELKSLTESLIAEDIWVDDVAVALLLI